MTQLGDFSILIVDDDKAMRRSLLELLHAAGWAAQAVSRAETVLEKMQAHVPDVILSDVRMPGMSGLDLLSYLQDVKSPPLVLISAHGDIPMAVKAMQDGAYNFVEKPYDPSRLLTILTHAGEHHRMRQNNVRLKERLFQLSGLDRVLLGTSKSVTELRNQILDLSSSSAPVLIQGETGTGKELVARALHDLSPRSGSPFLALNCAALSGDAFEVEMFGVHGQYDGRLVRASGGTLFLDEVGSCPPEVQAKLLRVIEDGQVLPVGSAAPVSVDLRMVSATNVDIDEAVQEGQLRQDFMFRLNTFVLSILPLRQRRDDLMLLSSFFLNELALVYEISTPTVSHDDLATLMAHDWPGNVRELRNVCERRILAHRRGIGNMGDAILTDKHIEDVPNTLREAVAAFERELIGKAIKSHDGRMDTIAEALGIGRRTLNEKIVKLGLDKNAFL
ncbi:sigma-54-dependent transcriptional regulator [Pseudopelagicola sp. nBUS_20]|uniref:sigma-54-dependent transcriptional regulator n=1 Tax=Pseudopelagicola sp. nBUS_20 TaxID=3395317 RepID=UPI003EBCEF45